ncbi:hypothetical protein [Polaribacter aquimarinus]|uniref:Uncharacterized protein n=1 Tax=Polaribacter aquimarinus TaxID=2100726 RepID=A0A2U2J6T2_9FLAO|nr:hypothetical protein [Polaribacter aquimarinus]PWG04049.1 hypothetical protein DIS07_14760 [Polaribacter aquimarinus]
MKKNELLFATLIFICFHSFSQVKVEKDKLLSSNQEKGYELLKKADEISSKVERIYKRHKKRLTELELKYGDLKVTYGNKGDYESLLSQVKGFNTNYNSSGIISYKRQEINIREQSFSLLNNKFDKSFWETEYIKLNGLKKNINQLIKKINQKLDKKLEEKKEINKDSNHKENLKKLDKKIQNEDFLLEKEDKEIKKIKSKRKKSVKDFLLEEEDTSTSDFLSEDNSDDFLIESIDKKKYEIKSKWDSNGMFLNGVIDSKGGILIPFKKWKILEYENGIAKVSILIDKEKIYNSACNEIYYKGSWIEILKEGFVDKRGTFIDSYIITEFGVNPLPFFIESYDSNMSYSERKRLKEKRKREEKLKSNKCKRHIVSKEKSILSNYKNY